MHNISIVNVLKDIKTVEQNTDQKMWKVDGEVTCPWALNMMVDSHQNLLMRKYSFLNVVYRAIAFRISFNTEILESYFWIRRMVCKFR